MDTHKRSSKTAFSERDSEIARLKLVLHAHITRTSVTQARLMATQDALDAFNSSHAQEINDLLLANNKLKRKLRAYHEFVKTTEMERDDLRDAVVSLVEKVDACNDYTLWPHSRIHISTLLGSSQKPKFTNRDVDDIVTGDLTDPVDSSPTRKPVQDAQISSDDDLLSYAAAMIDALTAERDAERQAHEHTRRIAHERISALEAQLALRESELEACVAHTAECFHPPSNAAESKLKAQPVEQGVAIKILELAAAKHRTVQAQNEYLVERLKAARHKLTFEPRTTGRSGCEVPTVDESDVPAGKGQPDETEDTIRGTRSGLAPKESALSAAPSLVDEMDLEIQELGRKIQAFKLERERLLNMIANESVKPNLVSEHEPFSPVHHNQTAVPPFRSQHSETSQHETNYLVELEKAYQSSLQREKALIEENAQLRMLRNHDSLDETQLAVTSNAPDPPLLLDAEDGEVSMELATPLLPTSLILSTPSPARSLGSGEMTRGDPNDLSLLDEASIPLPPSPPSPNIHSRSSPPARSESDPVSKHGLSGAPKTEGAPLGLPDDNLQHLDAELEHAQQQLTEGQKVLEDIEYVLNHVQFGDA